MRCGKGSMKLDKLITTIGSSLRQEAAAQGLLTVRDLDNVKLHYADGDAPKTVQDLRTLGVVKINPPAVNIPPAPI